MDSSEITMELVESLRHRLKEHPGVASDKDRVALSGVIGWARMALKHEDVIWPVLLVCPECGKERSRVAKSAIKSETEMGCGACAHVGPIADFAAAGAKQSSDEDSEAD